ncbi:putative aminoacyl-tRNA hydrolase [Helianthus annuus]|uniref:peptidyl-tRNA hydrolase n=1 Tax=Helianthus annuus TaxID=4232 RepID=A0A251RY65_HELAN|nr:peptidyl-tRNA hydrolase 2, mitochondrial [Helianthus annuus]KAF5759768.1 putative aminoacyl-tRNA hydrolase [Helianthus annuus]KAJ0437913.1 putative aminoacyl-tRNA hydrolase [Helianthus annuus]KAJ0460239.1 putative aminoacyl-tRNA hydrolase [Helianthus annuus]KAJ0640676.1 putative aminoacyl-tRNA hydrolase [Helianthus annuus]KAJ0644601.1 putative aminoacyl-tRNA hydrolase [Helianthus annuus]
MFSLCWSERKGLQLRSLIFRLSSLMMGSFRNKSQPSKSPKVNRGWMGRSFQPENFIPGLVIGFIFGILLDLSKPIRRNSSIGTKTIGVKPNSSNPDEDFKMVLVVRQDLKMGQGKVASQCAHAATGLYAKLMQSDQSLLRRWERCGQAKIVVTCKNQQEMNKLLEAAEGIGLPTYVVADAGRTQVSAGSKTVLAIGPGYKSIVDSVTGKQRLL